jgi:hypothetical protein
MRVEQTYWAAAGGWKPPAPGHLGAEAQLVLAFGGRAALQTPGVLDDLRRAYPSAHVTGCSTAGEIYGTQVLDDTVVATAVVPSRTPMTVMSVRLADAFLAKPMQAPRLAAKVRELFAAQ